MQTLKAGALYFAVVFTAGFVLGTIRVLGLVPLLGARAAELSEAPIMLAVTLVAARWVSRRLAVPPARPRRLAVGVVALSLMLAAELVVVLGLQRLTVREYLAARDPLAGTVYVVSLALFCVMPLLVARR
jgi:hypothetical protein